MCRNRLRLWFSILLWLSALFSVSSGRGDAEDRPYLYQELSNLQIPTPVMPRRRNCGLTELPDSIPSAFSYAIISRTADALVIKLSIQRFDAKAYAAIAFFAVDSSNPTLAIFEGLGSNTFILPGVGVGQHHLVVGTLDVFPHGVAKQTVAFDHCFVVSQ